MSNYGLLDHVDDVDVRSQNDFLRQSRILLASSDRRSRLVKVLKRVGYAVRVATSTTEVVAEFRQLLPPIAERGVTPGLLVIEHDETLDVLRLVRAAAALHISVVVIGLGHEMRTEAYALGASVIGGGFSVGDVLAIVQNLARKPALGIRPVQPA